MSKKFLQILFIATTFSIFDNNVGHAAKCMKDCLADSAKCERFCIESQMSGYTKERCKNLCTQNPKNLGMQCHIFCA